MKKINRIITLSIFIIMLLTTMVSALTKQQSTAIDALIRKYPWMADYRDPTSVMDTFAFDVIASHFRDDDIFSKDLSSEEIDQWIIYLDLLNKSTLIKTCTTKIDGKNLAQFINDQRAVLANSKNTNSQQKDQLKDQMDEGQKVANDAKENEDGKHKGDKDLDPEKNQQGGKDGELGDSSSSATHNPDEIISEAQNFINKGNSSDNATINGDRLKEASDSLYNILLSLGIVGAVIIGVYLGAKFMLSSAEDKAKVKEALIPYIAGCVVIFGAFIIWKLAINLLGSIDNIGKKSYNIEYRMGKTIPNDVDFNIFS